MPGGLRDEIDLDVTAALRQVDAIEASLTAAAKSFRVELAHALDVLRAADTHVDVTADARQVTGAITGAVDAADTAVEVTGDAAGVTGSIDSAVDAADTTVTVDANTRSAQQEVDDLFADLNDLDPVDVDADTRLARQQLDNLEDQFSHLSTEARTALDLDASDVKAAAKDVQHVEADMKDVKAATRDAETAMGGLRKAAGLALSALGARFVINEVREMIGAASDLSESQSKVDVVFGESKGVIADWAETSATSVGLAKQQALEAAGTFGNLFTALGLNQGAAAALSPQVVQLGADLASFNNLGVPDTLEKLRSGLVGEIEPLRSLGISFNAAQVEAKAMQLGLADANGEISEGAKVQARWALITEQSSAANGDFARTSDGLANQSRIMAAELGNARAELGERLLPLMLEVVQKGRAFLDFFLSLPEPVQNGALAFVAFAIALGPVLSTAGNVTKAITGIISGMTALATTTAASTIALGAFGAVAIGATATFIAYKLIVDSLTAVQDEFDARTASNVNTLALLGTTAGVTGDQLKAAAVDAFIAGEGMAANAEGTKAAGDAVVKATAAATTYLADFSEQSGITRERIVQLANEMRINLGSATDEQKEKLAAAAAQISGTIKPVDRLAAASEVLGNKFATTKEELKAFDEALDAALGVYTSSEEATIRVRQQLDELAKSYKAGRLEGETSQQFQDRLTLSTIDLTKKVEDEVAALTRSGDVSTEVGAQKQALISRFLALADTLGGPMADELREHAFRVAAIPEEKVTVIKADTGDALKALDGLAELAKSEGEDVAHSFAAGIVNQFRNEEGVVTASADRIAGSIDRAARARLGIKSPSLVGMEIGGFFVEGITLGVEAEAKQAEQAARALAGGVGDVMFEAAQITQAESLEILKAVAHVHDAEVSLSEARRDHGAASIEARIAELELADAQEEVNRRTMEAVDATDAVTEALERQKAERDALNGSLDDTLDALDAVTSVRSARRALDRANQELADAKARASALPGELAAAEGALTVARLNAAKVTATEALAIVRARGTVQSAEKRLADARAATAPDLLAIETATLEVTVAQEALAKAQADSIGPTREVEDAERKVKALRDESAAIAEKVRVATEAVTDAQLRLVGAERSLIEAGEALQATGPGWEEFFRSIATAAGLTRAEIDQLIDTMNEATRTAQNANSATGGGGRLINTITGRPAFTGPNGEGGWGAPRGVPGERSWTMPDGTRVWYVPGQNIDPGNVGALGRVSSGGGGNAAQIAALIPRINSGAGTGPGGVTFTPGADPALVAQVIASLGGIHVLGAAGGAKSVTLAAGDLIVKNPSDADYLLREAEFMATAGRFSK